MGYCIHIRNPRILYVYGSISVFKLAGTILAAEEMLMHLCCRYTYDKCFGVLVVCTYTENGWCVFCVYIVCV